MSVKTESLLAYLEANVPDIAEAIDADEAETETQIARLRHAVEAFEAMRKALRGAIEGITCQSTLRGTAPDRDWVAPRGACDCWGCETSRKARAALALADKNNGCVCNSGCESCDRLAEAFAAMREALTEATDYVVLMHTHGGDDGEKALEDRCYAALALASKVTRR